MNSIDSITKKITDDGATVANQKIQEAQAESAAILKDFEGQAAKIKNDAVKAAEKEANALLERVESQSDLARRNLLLQYKRVAISKAFEKALEQMCTMDTEKQIDILSSAAAKFQTADAQVILNNKDRQGFGDKLVERIAQKLKNNGKNFSIALSSKIGSFEGGMVLVEGSIETNCSYEILIKNIRDELENEVAKALYN